MPKQMTVDDMIKWINQLYENDNIHAFYIWGEWLKVRVEVIKDQHNECQDCKAKGVFTPATVGHHIKSLKKFPWLALIKSNIRALCYQCHETTHGRHVVKWKDERW